MPAVCWDNIPRGAAISCPSIEKALTSASYCDRVLGETGTRTVPATTVNFFTGNNIAPRGDMASRSLQVRLTANRADPENRSFKHTGPIGWTNGYRGNLMAAFYTVLLGNPRLRATNPEAPKTRFKLWWHLVGSAVEHAAKLANEKASVADIITGRRASAEISFRMLFLSGEADEEQTSSLATVLDALRKEFSGAFKAADVVPIADDPGVRGREFKAALESASGKPLPIVTATTVAWRLKAITDAPVLLGGGNTYALRCRAQDAGKRGGLFIVEAV